MALVGRKRTAVRDQLFPQKPPGSRFRFSRTGVQPSPGSSTIELPSAFAESGAYPPDRELPGSANPVRGHKEVPRSTSHIMVTTCYSDQQGSKSRQKVMRLYKRWHRPITKRYIKPPLLHIESSLDRLGLLSPTHDQRSQQQIGQIRSNQFRPTIFQVSQGHTSYKNKEK